MTETFHSRFNRNVITIFPGEYHVESSSAVISTLLGSCVAVVLYDPSVGVGGMNHFMLPEAVNEENFYISSAGKYGMYAMELLINGMLKKGAVKKNLKAKVFGGSSMFASSQKPENTISSNNIKVALNYLELENIPIVSSDFGGNRARRLYFFVDTCKVYVKKIQKSSIDNVGSLENMYFQRIKSKESSRRTFLFMDVQKPRN